jgi:gamma-glutamylcyclotransferase (GGCT)/AIG2-like uncharacterized protein YtfP
MAHEDAQLPFFVYGTLMAGYKNHKNFVRGRSTGIDKAVLNDAALFHLGGCPGILPHAVACTLPVVQNSASYLKCVYGELLWGPTNPDEYKGLLADLDFLEGYRVGASDNLYTREIVNVHLPDTDKIVEAYVYFCLCSVATGIFVPHGDWRRFMLEEGKEDAGDDWQAYISGAAMPLAAAALTAGAIPADALETIEVDTNAAAMA